MQQIIQIATLALCQIANVIKDQQGVYFLTFQIVSCLVPIAIGITRKRYRDIPLFGFPSISGKLIINLRTTV